MNIALIVHGGAKTIAPEKRDASKTGCAAAVYAGWDILRDGGSAIDAAEAAVRLLENDPTFNAGYGSALTSDGRAQMDAAIMEGRELNAGGVAAIEGVRHPVSIARRLLYETPVLLVGADARRFAAQRNLELCEPEALISDEQRRKWEAAKGQNRFPDGHDTVGAVALDSSGLLVAATSTGGLDNCVPGRVGDSPLIGCGLYADNGIGACALTGEGEAIIRMALAITTLDMLDNTDRPDKAVEIALDKMKRRVGGEAGCILITPDGKIGWHHNSENMACAYQIGGMSAPKAFVSKKEEQENA